MGFSNAKKSLVVKFRSYNHRIMGFGGQGVEKFKIQRVMNKRSIIGFSGTRNSLVKEFLS